MNIASNTEQVTQLILACSALALLTFIVGLVMLSVRTKVMKAERIHPQAVALSGQRSEKLKDTRASDNFNHLFELPVLFYALCGLAIASGQIPSWLPVAAWLFVLLRVIHSIIQCTNNTVMHRFYVFALGYLLLAGMWIGFAIQAL